jgi:hypothetical protein
VTRCGGVTTSAGAKAAPRREKRGKDASWTDVNLTESKNEKKNHTVDLADTNGW